MSKRIIGTAVTGIVLVGALIGGISCIERVPAGYGGVIYSASKGVIDDKVLSPGFHFLSPLEKVRTYPTSMETMYLSKTDGGKEDNSFDISTKGGKMVNVDAELSYRYELDKLPDVYDKWRGKTSEQIEDTYIKARIKEAANEITTQYDVLDVYGEKRSEINSQVFKQLEAKLAQDGIILETFNFTRIEPDEQTKVAIQAKVDAQQKLEQDKIEAERQAIANQKAIDMEKAKQEQENILNTERNKRIEANAKAEAEAVRIRATADAEANTKLGKSLTPELIEFKKIEAWGEGGAQVPTIQGGDVTPFVDMRTGK